jgi:S-adenosylmethionine-diacylglycerol 3-amino-3-carboxypropyl transferase
VEEIMSEKKYFQSLNYSLGNEDTAFEGNLTLHYSPKKILSVCGSGSRSLPLINKDTNELILVDLSKEQLMLAKLRLESIRCFNYDTFLMFWGYPPYHNNQSTVKRKVLFHELNIEDDVKEYFQDLYSSQDWKTILYNGKWERTFKFFSRYVRPLIGRKRVNHLFSFKTLEEQRKYLKQEFPTMRWNLLMTVFGNKALFNALLYKGDFIKKNVEESYFTYYKNAFENLFNNMLFKESFFVQLCFLGSIKYSEGLLYEAKKDVFKRIKENLTRVTITFKQTDLISAIKEENNLDFVSLSDVPSYFSGEIETSFLQDIKPHLSKNAIVVNRNYLRVPQADRTGYKDIANEFASLLSQEQVQMYRIEVLKNE